MTPTNSSPLFRFLRARSRTTGICLVGAAALATGVAQAQMMTGDDALTYHGVTLYGIVDVGLQCESHGAPFSDYFPGGSADIVQKNSNHSACGVTPSNLSQSRVGLTGNEPLVGDWSGVFKLETFFNPQSGDLSDALKSLVQNNGRSLQTQTTNLDSSVAGQIFQQSYVGLSSKTFGTITFGRQNTLLADAISKYDPQSASQAFSLIGLSGTTAGGGDTQDRRLDSSVKYLLVSNGVHFGAQYKFNDATGSANTAVQLQVGGEYEGLSVDGYYSKIKDAVSAAALSATQVTTLPTLPGGFSISNSLAATISDNTAFTLGASYNMAGVATLFAAYEHIRYANPSTPIEAGFDDIGGYKIAFPNNTAFPNDKILQVFWAGAKYAVDPSVDLIAAYYGYKQNSYAAGADAGCSSTVSGACSGNLNAVSFSAVYKAAKRFDLYAGIMYTGVKNGLANGYLNKNDFDPTIGFRFKF
jgi:predicted porin